MSDVYRKSALPIVRDEPKQSPVCKKCAWHTRHVLSRSITAFSEHRCWFPSVVIQEYNHITGRVDVMYNWASVPCEARNDKGQCKDFMPRSWWSFFGFVPRPWYSEHEEKKKEPQLLEYNCAPNVNMTLRESMEHLVSPNPVLAAPTHLAAINGLRSILWWIIHKNQEWMTVRSIRTPDDLINEFSHGNLEGTFVAQIIAGYMRMENGEKLTRKVSGSK